MTEIEYEIENKRPYWTTLSNLKLILPELKKQLTNISLRLDLALSERYDKELDRKYTHYEKLLRHIRSVIDIVDRLEVSNNLKIIILVPIESGLCYYVGRGDDCHIIQIIEPIYNKIIEVSDYFTVTNNSLQPTYTLTSFDALENAVNSNLAYLHGVIDEYEEKLPSQCNSNLRHEQEWWISETWQYAGINHIIDHLSDTDKEKEILLLKSESLTSYIGQGTEFHLIQITAETYENLQNNKNIVSEE